VHADSNTRSAGEKGVCVIHRTTETVHSADRKRSCTKNNTRQRHARKKRCVHGKEEKRMKGNAGKPPAEEYRQWIPGGRREKPDGHIAKFIVQVCNQIHLPGMSLDISPPEEDPVASVNTRERVTTHTWSRYCVPPLVEPDFVIFHCWAVRVAQRASLGTLTRCCRGPNGKLSGAF